MAEYPSDVIEWHLFESPARSMKAGHSPLHMGPFATEEECRSLLTSLNRIPRFSQGTLEVQKRYKQREKRIGIRLPVQVCRLSSTDKTWAAHTMDISTRGARLADLGEVPEVGRNCSRFVVASGKLSSAWFGSACQATGTAGHVGMECLTPETNIWDLDLSARTDDEPLLQEIAIAREVQRNLLPRHKPALRTLDYSGDCVQAHTVGGDYYDFLDMGPGRVGFVLADVAGKGVAAALLMANLQGSIHAGTASRDLPRLLASVNHHLYQYTEAARYATLFLGCYDDDTRSLAYVNCGHSPPLLLRGSGTVERLSATATVLGLFSQWECSLAQTRLQAGDVLSIFTDGITETTGSNAEEFGEERLLEIMRQSKDLDAAAILRHVEQAVEQFRASEYLQDDLTLVVAQGALAPSGPVFLGILCGLSPRALRFRKLSVPDLLLRREVSLAGANLQVFLQSRNLNRAVAPIGIEVCRAVGDHILAPQFVIDGVKGMRDVLHLERKECAAAGSSSNLFQHAIAPQHQAAVIGGNGVNNDLGALRHLNGLRPRDFALVVFPIAHDNDRLAQRMIRPVFQKFLFAGAVDGVIQSRTTAVVQLVHRPVKP